MKRILPLLLLLFTGLAGIQANAEVVSGLYEAEVPVSDKGETARHQAVLDAFRDVLVKASGYGGVLDDPAVAEAVGNAERYVQQFRYRERRLAGKPLVFWVQFNGTSVEQLLQTQNLPVWGNSRPVMLTWLAVEENGIRELVGTGDTAYAPALQSGAAARGIPLRLPLLDLTDRSNISASDVWGDFRGTIMEASRRYDAQVVLTGRLYRGRSGGYRVRWALYGQGEPVYWEDWGPDSGKLLRSAIDAAVDSVSLRYTQNHGQAGVSSIRLRVEDISNLQEYNRALRYLEGLNGVAGVEVTEMGAGRATFRLDLSGTRSSVVQALALGEVLDEVQHAGGMDEPPAGTGTELVYRLLK